MIRFVQLFLAIVAATSAKLWHDESTVLHARFLRRPAASDHLGSMLMFSRNSSNTTGNLTNATAAPTENPLCTSADMSRCLKEFTKHDCPWSSLPRQFKTGRCRDVYTECPAKFLDKCPPPPGAPLNCCTSHTQDCIASFKNELSCDLHSTINDVNTTEEFRGSCGRQLAACHIHFAEACSEVVNCESDPEVQDCIQQFSSDYECNWQARPSNKWYKKCGGHVQKCRHLFEKECDAIPGLEVGLYATDKSCKSFKPMEKPECGSKNATACVEDFKSLKCPNATTAEFQDRCAATLTFCHVRVGRECRGFWEASHSASEKMIPRRHRVMDTLNPHHSHSGAGNHSTWSYESPQHWSQTFPMCAGEKQSPINIDRAKVTYWANESVWEKVQHNALANRTLRNTGHSLQVNGRFGELTVNGTTYEMRQFHLHFPSEHKVDGKKFVGEVHFVHQAVGATGTSGLLVFAILLIQGERSAFLDTLGFQSKLPPSGLNVTIAGEIDPYEAFADQIDNQFYRYEGSLTTPPCTEGVRWFVFEEPAEVTSKQVKAFKKLFPRPQNDRPTQWLNDRMVEKNVLELVKPPKALGIKDKHVVPWYFWVIAGTIVVVVATVLVVGCTRVYSTGE
mmetsp:Transcript_22371/g.48836  ORF Transcript_22371/g.48836 Transcript_22371/m.48836 type:complete len:621 (+) Transcript_22371:175-2037(+)|eukprot:CAMPEP_0204272380 /NCGR_PEP_ID=MMETSP0468-20130131/22051_1 /ASSEMBLY_ACC=CAM_ASM_000383 /TAXON_ID=2969 /ORGANISM="Oxyrrhis marina" /LENGTH=620 /DNA_ID=CAMNT_0051248215 /DNA_START=175 /DNA_END=2037 /DNA_ORIENTATION=+